MEYPELIMLVRKILSGSLLFACQILLPGKISTGLSGKATAKKKQDFSKLSDRSVETCEAYRRGRACGSLPLLF